MIKRLIYILLLPGLAALFQSCLSTARISDYPRSADSYDFNKIANSKRIDTDKSWNSKTGFEYYLKTEVVDEPELIRAITGAVKDEKFVIKYMDMEKGTILAERGLQANEWKSVVGVYFQKSNLGIDIYIKCKITQDITGGWRDDRAQKIGNRICERIGKCQQSYSVKTTL